MEALGLPPQISACLFDLDGVITDTALVHAAAWQETLDSYLKTRAERANAPFVEDRVGQANQLVAHGAATVVTDLADLMSHR